MIVDLDAAAGFCEQAEGKLSTAAAVALAAAERAHELLSAGTAIGEEQYADWAEPAASRCAGCCAGSGWRRPRRRWLPETRGGQHPGRYAAPAARRAHGRRGLLPEVAALLGPPPPGRGSLEIERRRAFEAVRALLRGLAERNPVLLLVDDLQYAGQSTVELLHFLGREPTGTRLLVVATVRAEHDAQVDAALAPVARRVELGPLDPDAVAQLARAAGQGELAGRILERTRGHTLFVVEVLRALASGEAGVPESLRTAVQARVRRTGPPVEALLRAAAVLGSTVDPLTVGVMLDLVPATALELCEAALGARLLVVSGRDYEFANDLIRDVLYASTPEPTRLAHHRRAADLLTGQPESLARHAAAAGDRLRAGRAWLRAGEDAMGRFAASDAAALATQALDAGERVADAEVTARALVLRGRAHHAMGADAAALADLTLGADHARAAGDRRLEMLALYELGTAEFDNAFPAIAAADWTAAAVAMKSAIEINGTAGYPHTTAWYVAHQGWLARLCGRIEEAIRLGHQAVDLTEQHQVTWWQATACAMLGDTVLLAGDRAGAIALFEQGLAAARQAGVEGYLLRCAAPLAAATGSRALLEEATALLERASIPDGGAWMPGYEAYLSLAEGWLAADEPDRARAVLAPVLAVAEREPWTS